MPKSLLNMFKSNRDDDYFAEHLLTKCQKQPVHKQPDFGGEGIQRFSGYDHQKKEFDYLMGFAGYFHKWFDYETGENSAEYNPQYQFALDFGPWCAERSERADNGFDGPNAVLIYNLYYNMEEVGKITLEPTMSSPNDKLDSNKNYGFLHVNVTVEHLYYIKRGHVESLLDIVACPFRNFDGGEKEYRFMYQRAFQSAIYDALHCQSRDVELDFFLHGAFDYRRSLDKQEDI